MLFNSQEFLVLFGISLFGFAILRKQDFRLVLSWLIVCSLVFYGWNRPLNLAILAASGSGALFSCLGILWSRKNNYTRLSFVFFLTGLTIEIGMLGYFKYANFFQRVYQDISGNLFPITEIILPLAISFYTFQLIAFTIDVYTRRLENFRILKVLGFLVFFPQLIAGPIVHYQDVSRQFESLGKRRWSVDLSVGITLFSIGLFKKVVLADGIAQYVSPVYAAASQGEPMHFGLSLIAGLGYTLQLYFDFSAYSDMALGLARCFGLKIPANFNSPLKAKSIIEFWSRWHITLTRFFNTYIYNPLAMLIARRRIKAGKAILSPAKPNAGAFLSVLCVPIFVTMFISGVWHGAGYTFIVWGVLHGIYLIVNHSWRLLKRRAGIVDTRTLNVLYFVLTLTCIVISMVIFRAPDMKSAVAILDGFTNFGDSARWVNSIGIGQLLFPGSIDIRNADFLLGSALYIVVLMAIALVLPNPLQLMRRYQPTSSSIVLNADRLFLLKWRPSLGWLLVTSVIMFCSMLRIGSTSEFLYWQF